MVIPVLGRLAGRNVEDYIACATIETAKFKKKMEPQFGIFVPNSLVSSLDQKTSAWCSDRT